MSSEMADMTSGRPDRVRESHMQCSNNAVGEKMHYYTYNIDDTKSKSVYMRGHSNLVDSSSGKNRFDWVRIDNERVPYILRDNVQHVSVRMLESSVLASIPTSPAVKTVLQGSPLTSYYITNAEAKLLNEVNVEHCNLFYGPKPFTVNDVVVRLSDFHVFFNKIKVAVNNSHACDIEPSQDKHNQKMQGWWLQVNNTVMPCIFKEKEKLVPLSVIRYSAGLLTEIPVDAITPSEAECQFINDLCRAANLNFTFTATAKLMKVSDLCRLCTDVVCVKDLSSERPFEHAVYTNIPRRSSGSGEQNTTTPINTRSRPWVYPDLRKGQAMWINSNQGNVRAYARSDSYDGVVGNVSKRPLSPSSGELPHRRCSDPEAFNNMQNGVASNIICERSENNTSCPASSDGSNRDISDVLGDLIKNALEDEHVQEGSSPENHRKYSKSTEEQNTTNGTPKQDGDIVPWFFEGRYTSVMLVGMWREPCALLEALNLYFPGQKIRAFQQLLEEELSLKLMDITPSQECKFIAYYSLPTKQLKCNKLVRMKDFVQYYPHMKTISQNAKRRTAHTTSSASRNTNGTFPSRTVIAGSSLSNRLIGNRLNQNRSSHYFSRALSDLPKRSPAMKTAALLGRYTSRYRRYLPLHSVNKPLLNITNSSQGKRTMRPLQSARATDTSTEVIAIPSDEEA